MICANCGKAIGLDEKFCGYCGKPRPKLPKPFEETENKYKQLKARCQSGELDEAGFQEAMKALIFQDDRGSYWMIGSESEQWYRYDGKDWLQEEPPHITWKEVEEPAGTSDAAPAIRATVKAAETIQSVQPPARAVAAPAKIDSIAAKPKQGSSCGKSCLIGGAILAAVLVLFIGGGFLAWRLFQNEIVNFALKQGWGEVVETGVPTDLPIVPTAFEPNIFGAENETQETWVLPPVTPIEGWKVVEFPVHNLVLELPENYLNEVNPDEGYLWIADPNPDQAISLIVYFEAGTESVRPEDRLKMFLDELSDYQWTELKNKAVPIGQLIWSEGILESNLPIFLGVIGPLEDGSMIRFEGQCFWGNWDEVMQIWMQLIDRIAYR